MPRKPTISPRKLSIYLACQTQYYWTYLDARGRFYARNKSYFSFGTSLHKVLEAFHRPGGGGLETTRDVLASYEESWIEAGYSSSDEMAEAFGEGREILKTYVERVSSRPTGGKTILVESMLRMDMGEFDLIGRVDRVDEYADGLIEVVDYKSGRMNVTEDAVKSDLAMTCYQLLVREKFPGRRVRARIEALRPGVSAVAELSDEEALAERHAIYQLGSAILAREYEDHEPELKPICAWGPGPEDRCDFYALCWERRAAVGSH